MVICGSGWLEWPLIVGIFRRCRGRERGGDFLRNLRNAAPDDPETRQAAQLPSTYC